MDAENFQERRRGNGVKRKRAAEMNLPDLKASPSLMFRLESRSVGFCELVRDNEEFLHGTGRVARSRSLIRI